ncbi:MAG: hypothetical protein AMJ53_09515 [Gammaproteobacteria bacterium SG8_11]|nr:MAG: hypothetical protein AMJ53_09515 [Gammaproteobacteria bacterium SG8_11]
MIKCTANEGISRVTGGTIQIGVDVIRRLTRSAAAMTPRSIAIANDAAVVEVCRYKTGGVMARVTICGSGHMSV